MKSNYSVYFILYSEIENETILECSTMMEGEGMRSSNVITALPAWLQLYKKENQHNDTVSNDLIILIIRIVLSPKIW